MAVRSNIGNIITNGMQILSVGATTASRVLGDATSSLNNLSREERDMIKQADAQKRLEGAKDYLSNSETDKKVKETERERKEKDVEAYGELSEEQKLDFARKRYGSVTKENQENIDDLVSPKVSTQAGELNTNVKNNIEQSDALKKEKDSTLIKILKGVE